MHARTHHSVAGVGAGIGRRHAAHGDAGVGGDVLRAHVGGGAAWRVCLRVWEWWQGCTGAPAPLPHLPPPPIPPPHAPCRAPWPGPPSAASAGQKCRRAHTQSWGRYRRPPCKGVAGRAVNPRERAPTPPPPRRHARLSGSVPIPPPPSASPGHRRLLALGLGAASPAHHSDRCDGGDGHRGAPPRVHLREGGSAACRWRAAGGVGRPRRRTIARERAPRQAPERRVPVPGVRWGRELKIGGPGRAQELKRRCLPPARGVRGNPPADAGARGGVSHCTRPTYASTGYHAVGGEGQHERKAGGEGHRALA